MWLLCFVGLKGFSFEAKGGPSLRICVSAFATLGRTCRSHGQCETAFRLVVRKPGGQLSIDSWLIKSSLLCAIPDTARSANAGIAVVTGTSAMFVPSSIKG